MSDDLRRDVQTGFKEVQEKFVEVHEEFVAVRTEMQGIRAEIKAEGETTRRHFDIVAEQSREHVKLLADGIVRNTERLDEHDTRLTALEKPRG